MFLAVPKSTYISPLPINCSTCLATACVSCHLDELGKTAHVNGNQTWKRSGAQSHEESGCAVAPSGHNATHVPAKESSKSYAHSLCGDVEKAGVNKLLAKPEELGSAHESWSSARLLCTWSRGPGRPRGTRCSAFAEKLHVFARSSGSTRPRTDAAATLRVCILVEYSLTLAVLDFFAQEKGKHHGNITEMAK